jgi:hypothetical protein
MPILTGWLGADGALVDVLVGWSASGAQSLRAALRPVPPASRLRALLDTGAEMSCLEVAAVGALGLPVHGMTPVNLPAAGGLSFGTQYEASLTVLHPSGNSAFDLVVSDLVMIELPLGPLGYQALIGRDVLAQCHFQYHGPKGKFRLSY